MSTLALPSTPPARTAVRPARDRLPVGTIAMAGGGLVIVGAAAPWLSFFAGLQPIAGLDGLNGRVAAGLGVATIAASLLFLATGRPALRWVLGVLGFAVLGLAAWSGVNLITTLAEVRADPLLVADIGPGLPVLAAGGGLAFATLFLPGAASHAGPSISAGTLRTALAAALGAAGLVHLAVAPEHLAESPLVGGAMAAGGVAQLVLAALVSRRTTARWPLVLAIALNAVLALAWVAAVTVGLPVEPHAEAGMAAAGHGAVGHTEAVTPLGAVTLVLELGAAAVAFLLLAVRGQGREAAGAVDASATRRG